MTVSATTAPVDRARRPRRRGDRLRRWRHRGRQQARGAPRGARRPPPPTHPRRLGANPPRPRRRPPPPPRSRHVGARALREMRGHAADALDPLDVGGESVRRALRGARAARAHRARHPDRRPPRPRTRPPPRRHRIGPMVALHRTRSRRRTRCHVVTGDGPPRDRRAHQIRVHLAHWGYPIVGDGVYGRRAPGARLGDGGFALHARRLGFEHPVTGLSVVVESPAPEWESYAAFADLSGTSS